MAHEVPCEPDLDGQADYLWQLSKNERVIQVRFENDLYEAKSVEKLLFGLHDFYSVNRIWKMLKCV